MNGVNVTSSSVESKLATESCYDIEKLNGSVWLAKWPLCWTVIVQYIDQDNYIILCSPENSVSGGTCMIAFEREGKIIRTYSEIVSLLKKWAAKRINKQLILENIKFKGK